LSEGVEEQSRLP